jgi:LmbE family N-acetylglucosaminyl deacetylase
VGALGGSSLHFMDYIDPTVGADNELYAFEGDEAVFAEKIMDEIRALKADVVISHGSDGEYGHPAHLKVHRGVKQALLNLPEMERPLFYTFQGAFSGHPKERVMNQSDPAHIILDIASVAAEKLAAISCHKTQQALFLRHVEPDEQGQRFLKQAVMPLESLHRVFPAVESLPVQDALTDLLAGVEGVTLLSELNIPVKS